MCGGDNNMMNRTKLQLGLERLEDRRMLAAGPMLWMEDNNLGFAGGMPADFIQRFENTESWARSLRAIDTLMIRENSWRNVDGVTRAEVQNKISPVLDASQVDVAVDTGAATWLHRRMQNNSLTASQTLQPHFDWLQTLIDDGLQVKTVTLQSVLSKTAPGDAHWQDYSMEARLDDVVTYSELLRQRFPHLDVGIVDALPTHGRDWRTHYRELDNRLDAIGIQLDHVHLDMPVDFVGPAPKSYQWSDVIEIQRFVKEDLSTEFGFMLTSSGGGNSSARQWREASIAGLADYGTALQQSATVSQPDRIIVAAWFPNPASSVPENQYVETNVGGTIVRERVESLTAAVFDATSILIGQPTVPNQVIEELRQVFPVSITATSDAEDAQAVGFASKVVDASSIQRDASGWNPAWEDSDRFLMLAMPNAVELDRARVWVDGDGFVSQNQMTTSVYVSRTGEGNPATNSDGWKKVAEDTRPRHRNQVIDLEFTPTWANHVAVSNNQIHEEAGGTPVDGTMQAVRVYATSTNWPFRAAPDSSQTTPAPLLWMQDNSLGREGGLPADFLQRFDDPDGWEHAMRAIDTLSLNEHAIINANGITDDVLRDTIAPVLNRNQVNVSINSMAANFLNHRSRATGQSMEELLSEHFAWLDRLVNSGLRIRTLSINGPLTRVPADLAGRIQYPLSDRIDDVVQYVDLLRARYPNIDVGIQDNLIDLGADYRAAYGQLNAALQAVGHELDHIHYYRFVDLIGPDRAIDWPDVIEMQNFVQSELGSEFGIIVNGSGGSTSADQWRHDVIFNGIKPYLDWLTPQSGQTPRLPDRFIIAAWNRYPELSFPEDRVLVDGSWRGRDTTTGAIQQASNLIRGYADGRSSAMVDEIQQVQPINAWGSINDETARLVVLGDSLVDANTVIESQQWLPEATSADQHWVKAELPISANLDRIRVWLATDGDLRHRETFIRVFASDTGIGDVFNDEHWDIVGQVWIDGREAESFVIPVEIHQKRFVGVGVFYGADRGPHEVRGLGAIRFYSPNNNWNGGNGGPDVGDHPPDTTRPVLTYQRREVTWGDPGATVTKVIADGYDVAGKYDLSVDDPRFGFFLSFLTLRAGEVLDDGEEGNLTVNLTLTDRDDPRREFSYPFTFAVTSRFDSNFESKDLYDYGDAYWYVDRVPGESFARHLMGDLYLGDHVDPELAPQNEYLARGDDMDIDGDDDDGVVFIGDVERWPDNQGAGTIRVHASATGMLDGWIDFNGNRVFDPEEHLFGGQSVGVDQAKQLIDFAVPSTAVVDRNTFARFRISSGGGLRPYDDSPRGPDVVGEVEDYVLRVVDRGADQIPPPVVSFQTYPVLSGFEGATVAKILADGFDAEGKYRLSVDDSRFEFERSFLRLKSDRFLLLDESPTDTVRITLTDRTDASRVFQEDLAITVRDNTLEFFDYGDAPYRFGTTRWEDGPRHRVTTLSLGRRIDAEADGQNQYQAMGDDIDSQGDDEDGVVLVSNLVSSSRSQIATVVVDSSADAMLDAWIDFNGNGRFDHPEEHLGQNRSGQSILVSSGMNVIDFVVPAGAEPGWTFARFRLSSAGGLTPLGLAEDGEVEDYRWRVESESTAESLSFAWPNLSLAEPPAMNISIQAEAQEQVIRDGERVLATFPTTLESSVRIVGSHGNDRLTMLSLQSVVDRSIEVALDEGNDELELIGQTQVDFSDLPLAALAGVDRINFRQAFTDTITITPEGISDAIGHFEPVELIVDSSDSITFAGQWEGSNLVILDGVVMHRVNGLGSTVLLRNDRNWTNLLTPADVNRDGTPSALDALLIINRLNRFGGTSELPERTQQNFDWNDFDVSGDGSVTALDALQVINQLNRISTNEINNASGEFIAVDSMDSPVSLPANRRDLFKDAMFSRDTPAGTAAFDSTKAVTADVLFTRISPGRPSTAVDSPHEKCTDAAINELELDLRADIVVDLLAPNRT